MIKILSNGNYEITKDELTSLVKDREELCLHYHNGIKHWNNYCKNMDEYLHGRLHNFGVNIHLNEVDSLCFMDVVDIIIDKIYYEENKE